MAIFYGHTPSYTRAIYLFSPCTGRSYIPTNAHWHYNIYYNDASAAYLQPLREITLCTAIPTTVYNHPLLYQHTIMVFFRCTCMIITHRMRFFTGIQLLITKIQSLSEFFGIKKYLYLILYIILLFLTK